jgi:hypothetical protein
MDQELSQTIDENIENLPEEVNDFMFGKDLEEVLNEITALTDRDNEKLSLRNDINFFLLGITPMEDIITHINGLSVSDEKKIAIKKLIQEKIVNELVLLTEVYEDMDKTIQASTPMTPSSALTNLQSRLTQPTMIMPVKRDLSPDATPAAAPSVSVPTKPAIDPYRELPDK